MNNLRKVKASRLSAGDEILVNKGAIPVFAKIESAKFFYNNLLDCSQVEIMLGEYAGCSILGTEDYVCVVDNGFVEEEHPRT